MNVRMKNAMDQKKPVDGRQKPLSVTVGIPTCYGEPSILTTVESILASRDAVIDRFIIISDRIPLPDETRRKLAELKVELIWNTEAGSWARKIRQMVDACDTDILVTTQDDVLFDPHALAEIIRAFDTSGAITMVASMIEPLPPKTLMEGVLSAAVRIPFRISSMWKDGDNYLSASGRCFSFRAAFAKRFRLPEDMMNGDAFLYFENKRLGGRMRQATRSTVYIRQPQNVKDQIGPSSRYQIQKEELSEYFDFDLASEYRIPFRAGFRAVLAELLRHPVNTLLYLPVLAYTRLFRESSEVIFNPMWDPDTSTKDIAQP